MHDNDYMPEQGDIISEVSNLPVGSVLLETLPDGTPYGENGYGELSVFVRHDDGWHGSSSYWRRDDEIVREFILNGASFEVLRVGKLPKPEPLKVDDIIEGDPDEPPVGTVLLYLGDNAVIRRCEDGLWYFAEPFGGGFEWKHVNHSDLLVLFVPEDDD